MCDKASKNGTAEGGVPGGSSPGDCWESQGEWLRVQGASLSQLKFRFQRLERNGTLDTPWNLIFNPLSVYLLFCQGRP